MIYKGKDLKFIQQRAKGFLEVVDRKESQRQDMWKERARQVTTTPAAALQRCTFCIAHSCATPAADQVDSVAQWTIPSGFLAFIAVLYNMVRRATLSFPWTAAWQAA